MPLPPLLGLVLLLCAPDSAAAAAHPFQGLPVQEIRVKAPTPADEQRLIELLAIRREDLYDLDKVRQSIERLYATGRFYDIQVDAERRGGGLTLTFITQENFFIGGVFVEGVPEPPSKGQLASATKLELGELWTSEKQAAAMEGLKRVLEDNGFYQAIITPREQLHSETQQIDLFFAINAGERARIAGVEIIGNGAFPAAKVKQESGLKPGKELTARRLQNAIARLRKFYQRHEYLEAELGITERRHLPAENQVHLVLSANAGRQVEVRVTGAKLSAGKRRELLPIYDEGSVDADLLREGENNLRDYFQRKGYFDVRVAHHTQPAAAAGKVVVEYHVEPGDGHKVQLVEITGNRYFRTPTIRERMFIAEDALLDAGRYSPQYLARDVESIRILYTANGFPNVKVTPTVDDNYQGKHGSLAVRIHIEEGPQTLIQSLKLEGHKEISDDQLRGMVASGEGQPFSEFNILLDRDTLLTYYFNQGFPEAAFTPDVRLVAGRNDRMDVVYKITEGRRQYVNQVLISGLENTRPSVVDRQVQLKANDPLSQVDMLETQRRLYDLGIFQKVEMAMQNREGEERHKNLLFQIEEARRYTVSVGGGADIARFGGDAEGLAETEGRAGFSPRVSLDVTRLNFRGRNHTLSFKSRFSTLQQRGLISYIAPRVFNVPSLTWVFNVFYDRSFDVLTFRSERLEGSVALEHKRSRSDTLLYRYSYRRVRAERDTLKVSVDLIPLFARPVRVGMLGATLVRDRRDDPADSKRGMFFTLDGGVSARQFGSQTSFARALAQHTTYHRLGLKLVVARNTQFGLADPFGKGRRVPLLDDTGQPLLGADGGELFQLVRDIPLPERFFSGGGNSHRGFGVNQAGPRDIGRPGEKGTGFPLGGGALLMNSVELRFPVMGPNIGGALFHDFGNVFQSLNDLSFRFSQRGNKDFAYMVHAVGAGLRYKTPIGPVRLDAAWSFNPPAYEGLAGTRKELLARTGRVESRRLSHFQFFFSIGQTF